MIVGHGIDVIQNERIRRTIEVFGDRFISRTYTPQEIAVCRSKKESIERFAAFWAVKESVMKALGTGFRRGVRWKDIEVCHEPSGKPFIRLHGESHEIARSLGVSNIVVSMSHVQELSIASVIFEKNGQENRYQKKS